MIEKEMDFKENHFVSDALKKQINLLYKIESDHLIQHKIIQAAENLVGIYKNKGKLLLCGNGGSAAQAQHLATELVSRFYLDRQALNAESLAVNTSSITSIANDYHFDQIFSRQIEAKGEKGDMLISLSASGKSKNIIQAIKTACRFHMFTVALIGDDASTLPKCTDLVIAVPSDNIPQIQEIHLFIGHLICEYVERELFQ